MEIKSGSFRETPNSRCVEVVPVDGTAFEEFDNQTLQTGPLYESAIVHGVAQDDKVEDIFVPAEGHHPAIRKLRPGLFGFMSRQRKGTVILSPIPEAGILEVEIN